MRGINFRFVRSPFAPENNNGARGNSPVEAQGILQRIRFG